MRRKEYLDQFKKRREKIVRLRDVKKLTWAEIADQMGGVSQTAVLNAYKREKEEGV